MNKIITNRYTNTVTLDDMKHGQMGVIVKDHYNAENIGMVVLKLDLTSHFEKMVIFDNKIFVVVALEDPGRAIWSWKEKGEFSDTGVLVQLFVPGETFTVEIGEQ